MLIMRNIYHTDFAKICFIAVCRAQRDFATMRPLKMPYSTTLRVGLGGTASTLAAVLKAAPALEQLV